MPEDFDAMLDERSLLWGHAQARKSDHKKGGAHSPPKRSQPSDSDPFEPEYESFYPRVKKASPSELTACSSELVDIVKLCNAAARCGKKDLLWLCWNAGASVRKTAPSFGSNLIALTADGARKMQQNFQAWFGAKTHWDLALRYALEKNDTCRRELTAAYVYPAVGHYDEHESMQGNGVRESTWSKQWAQSGTRKPTELTAGKKWWDFEIRGFEARGNTPVLRSVKFPEDSEELEWWTAGISMDATLTAAWKKRSTSSQPPTGQAMNDGTWVNVDEDKGRVDKDPAYGEVFITCGQTVEALEEPKDTNAWFRIARGHQNMFLRRNFTNNPNKARMHTCYL